MEWKRLLALVVSFVIYLCIGAAIFRALEGDKEGHEYGKDSHDMDSPYADSESGGMDFDDNDFKYKHSSESRDVDKRDADEKEGEDHDDKDSGDHDDDDDDDDHHGRHDDDDHHGRHDDDDDDDFDFHAFIVEKMGDSPCLDAEGIVGLVEELAAAKEEHMSAQTMIYEYERNKWDYCSSFFFVVTTVTTIGYGNLVPETCGGKFFFVLYAIFGIPLCFLVLIMVADKMLDRIKALEGRALGLYGSDKWRQVRLVILLLVDSFFWIIFLAVPAIGLAYTEGWSYGEAFYYGVTTLFTIGLGDLIAGMNSDGMMSFNVLLSIWILLGLTFLLLPLLLLIDTFKNWGQGAKMSKAEEAKKSAVENGYLNPMTRYTTLPDNKGTATEEKKSPPLLSDPTV